MRLTLTINHSGKTFWFQTAMYHLNHTFSRLIGITKNRSTMRTCGGYQLLMKALVGTTVVFKGTPAVITIFVKSCLNC